MRRRWFLLLAVMFFALSCSLVTGPESSAGEVNTCYSEQNLTEEECDNAGKHTYTVTGSSEGIGNAECAFDDGSAYLQDTATVTIQFSGNGSMVLDHPEQEIWDETVHQFTRTSENTYIYEGIIDGMDEQWTIVFEWWGYQEQMELTYDCAAGICGCSSSFENRLR